MGTLEINWEYHHHQVGLLASTVGRMNWECCLQSLSTLALISTQCSTLLLNASHPNTQTNKQINRLINKLQINKKQSNFQFVYKQTDEQKSLTNWKKKTKQTSKQTAWTAMSMPLIVLCSKCIGFIFAWWNFKFDILEMRVWGAMSATESLVSSDGSSSHYGVSGTDHFVIFSQEAFKQT